MSRGTMSTFSFADKTITLHPWISPPGRAEVLLFEVIKRLSDRQGSTQRRKRGMPTTEEPRSWLVQGLVGRHFGMETDTAHVSAVASWEPTLAEELLVKTIVGAIVGAETGTKWPDIHSTS